MARHSLFASLGSAIIGLILTIVGSLILGRPEVVQPDTTERLLLEQVRALEMDSLGRRHVTLHFTTGYQDRAERYQSDEGEDGDGS